MVHKRGRVARDWAVAIAAGTLFLSGIGADPWESAHSAQQAADATLLQLAEWAGLDERSIEELLACKPAVESAAATNGCAGDRLSGYVGGSFDAGANRIMVPADAPLSVIRHETAHAFIRWLKPGWTRGVTLVIHEALADITAVLMAYLELADGAACLKDEETRGRAASISTPHGPRSVCNSVTADAIGFDPNRVHFSEIPVPNTCCDPHYVAGILSGAMYDVLRISTAEPGAAGYGTRDAATHAVGRVFTRALLFCGEHRVSLVQFRDAVEASDRRYNAGRLRAHIEDAFAARGVAGPTNDGPERRAGFCVSVNPAFGMEPSYTAGALVPKLLHLEEAFVQHLRTLSVKDRIRGVAADYPLLLHRPTYPHPPIADGATLTVDRELVFDTGHRLIRVSYSCPIDQATERRLELGCGGNPGTMARVEHCAAAYASYLFDSDGAPVAVHVDRPLPRTLY